MRSLLELKNGESGIIKEITNDVIALRLIELGCFPGEKITLSKRAPLGCPLAIKMEGNELSIRKDEAAFILVEPAN